MYLLFKMFLESIIYFDLLPSCRLAPLALRAVYENEAHLCQRVAQSLSWTLLYTSGRDSLQQLIVDFPHYALFISPTSEEAVLSIRSTGRINVILDELTNSTVEFPPSFPEIIAALHPSGATSIGQQQLQYGASPAYTFDDDNIAYLKESVPKMRPVNVESINQLDDDCSNDWELVNQNDTLSTYATSAVVRAAMQLLREVGPSLVTLVKKGLSIKVIGHSLGGSIAALIVSMLSNLTQTEESADSSSFNVFDGKISGCAYGSPCCMDLETSKQLKACGFTSIVLQDDVTARLSISTIK